MKKTEVAKTEVAKTEVAKTEDVKVKGDNLQLDNNKLYIKGVIASCGRKRGFNGKGELENRFSVKLTPTDNDMNVISEFGKQFNLQSEFCPSWINSDARKEDGTLYINLHSKFDITITSTEIDDFSEINVGARVLVAVKRKERAIYPMFIRVDKNGESYNPFEGCEL